MQHLVEPVLVRLGPAVLANLDEVVEHHVRWVQEQLDGYGTDGIVDTADLRLSAEKVMRDGIQLLTDPDADGFDDATDLGRRRATQGVPLDALLSAFRLGGRALWEGFLRAARASSEPVDQDALLDSASAVWRMIDQMTAAVGAGYREQERLIMSRNVRERQSALAGLIEGRGADHAFERQAARVLNVPIEGTFACLAVLLDAAKTAPATAVEQALRHRGIASAWHARAEYEIGLVAATAGMDALVSALSEGATAPVGVSPLFDRLALTVNGARLAELAARTLPAGAARVAVLDERLPEALVASDPEIRARLIAATTGGLAGLQSEDREVLLETLRALLATGGSLKAAGELLFCHRNTVLYRINRVRELTGRGVSSERDRLHWSLALLAREQPR